MTRRLGAQQTTADRAGGLQGGGDDEFPPAVVVGGEPGVGEQLTERRDRFETAVHLIGAGTVEFIGGEENFGLRLFGELQQCGVGGLRRHGELEGFGVGEEWAQREEGAEEPKPEKKAEGHDGRRGRDGERERPVVAHGTHGIHGRN